MFGCVGFFLLGCAEGLDGEEGFADLGVLSQEAVYGSDDRLDYFEVEDEALKARALRASVALIGHTNLLISDPNNVQINAPTLGTLYQLCDTELFSQQPSAARCSGVLIDDDLVLTASHCVTDARECGGRRLVFNYLYAAEGQLATITRDDVYQCRRVVLQDETMSRDWAVIQLDRPVNPDRQAPAEIQAQPVALATGAKLILVGFGSGLPMKLDVGGRVVNGHPDVLDHFKGTTDSFGGHSGAGVMDENLRVVGVLNSGAEDYVLSGGCQVAARYPADGQGAGEAATYSHHPIQALCATGWPSARLCGRAPQCGDGFCTGDETTASCGQDCTTPVPPWEWFCNATYYGTGDDCDCDCGAFDPDCADLSLRIYGCAAGEVCDAQGQCSTERRPAPDAWTCDPDAFDDSSVCDCACGAFDPDCNDTTRPVLRCEPPLVCDPTGACVIDTSPPRPDTWHCNPAFYASGDDCDCGCGAPDPDCADPLLGVYGCAVGELCTPSGVCERPANVPLEWECSVAYYAAGDDCDCDCGAFDPDCLRPELDVLNCPPSHTCGAQGQCEPNVPPSPAPEDCDCGVFLRAQDGGPSGPQARWWALLFSLGCAVYGGARRRRTRRAPPATAPTRQGSRAM